MTERIKITLQMLGDLQHRSQPILIRELASRVEASGFWDKEIGVAPIKLPRRQREVWEFLKRWKGNAPPTYKEIGLGVWGDRYILSNVRDVLVRLRDKGLITFEAHKPRSIVIQSDYEPPTGEQRAQRLRSLHPYTPEEMLRRRSVFAAEIALWDEPPGPATCDKCERASTCVYAYDIFNTGGACAAKDRR